MATDYKDAILIPTQVIEDENREIVNWGEKNVKILEDIKVKKKELRKIEWEKKKLDLEIVDFEEKTRDVQMYRVTTKTKDIINGLYKNRDDEEKKLIET